MGCGAAQVKLETIEDATLQTEEVAPHRRLAARAAVHLIAGRGQTVRLGLAPLPHLFGHKSRRWRTTKKRALYLLMPEDNVELCAHIRPHKILDLSSSYRETDRSIQEVKKVR